MRPGAPAAPGAAPGAADHGGVRGGAPDPGLLVGRLACRDGNLRPAVSVEDLAGGHAAGHERCGGDPARLAAMGEEAFTAAVRGAVRDWGGKKAWGTICRGSSPR